MPAPNAIGTIPSTAAMLVIRIGRNLFPTAASIASRGGSPAAFCAARSSMIRIALFTTMPISITKPSSPKIDSGIPAHSSASSMPISASGTVNMIRNGRVHDSMIAAISK